MASRGQIQRWGNSLAVRIPKHVAEEAELSEGDSLLIEATGQGVLALKTIEQVPTLEELVSGITKRNLHSATEWGKPVGKELW